MARGENPAGLLVHLEMLDASWTVWGRLDAEGGELLSSGKLSELGSWVRCPKDWGEGADWEGEEGWVGAR